MHEVSRQAVGVKTTSQRWRGSWLLRFKPSTGRLCFFLFALWLTQLIVPYLFPSFKCYYSVNCTRHANKQVAKSYGANASEPAPHAIGVKEAGLLLRFDEWHLYIPLASNAWPSYLDIAPPFSWSTISCAIAVIWPTLTPLVLSGIKRTLWHSEFWCYSMCSIWPEKVLTGIQQLFFVLRSASAMLFPALSEYCSWPER